MNMRKNKHIPLIAAAALLLLGCVKEPDAGRITVEACIGAPTKVAYDGAKSSFAAGDKITVYGWTGGATAVPAERVVDGVVNTLGGDGKWTPEKQMRWKPGGEAHYFLGVSPARAITDFAADSYTLDPTKYAESDLLVATNVSGLKAQGNSVALSFEHALAKLNVNLKFRSQWETEPTVTSVTAMAKKTATVNYLAEAKLTATGTAEAVALTASSNAAWSGLQVPQTDVNTITVTIEGKDYVYTHTADIPLVSGSCTTVNLTVGRDRIELANAITIADWTSQDAAMEGVAKMKLKLNGHEYVDLGLSVKWATCNVGAKKPEDYGDYFAWGVTEPYYSSQEPLVWKDGIGSGYAWSSYFDTSDGGNTFTKYTKDKKTVLEAIDDAATSNWGKVSVNFEPAANEGKLKTIEKVIWQNPDPDGGCINWSGQYRFAGEGHGTGEEICVVPADQWEKMKTSTFYVVFKEPGAQIRITTGWWSTTWTGFDIFVGNEWVTENEDGTYTLAVNLAGDPILDLIDQQHLLFTGGGYTPLKIYFAEQVAPWRMPTDAEWTELRTKCTWTWTTRNGVKGYLVSNNGDSIFLPAAGYRNGTSLNDVDTDGYYWSSSLDLGYPMGAMLEHFDSGVNFMCYGYRCYGLPVRPVTD